MSKEICDVVVVGGGAAGIAAAISAARHGARTYLIESQPEVGAVFHRLGSFEGLYPSGLNTEPELLNGGLVSEFVADLTKHDKLAVPMRQGRTWVLPYTADTVRGIITSYFERINSRLTVLPSHRIQSVLREGDQITGIECYGQDGILSLSPKIVIDCTGNAVIARLAKAAVDRTPEDKRQMGFFTGFITGLKDADESLNIKVPYHLNQAIAEAGMFKDAQFTSFALEPRDNTRGYLKLNFSRYLELLPNEANSRLEKVVEYLSKQLNEFGGSHIERTSKVIIEREGPRLVGKYRLSADDVLSAHKFDDDAVKNAWPIEFWAPDAGPSYTYLPEGDYYTIPTKCMQSSDIANLYCAGKTLSATQEAACSARAAGACIAMGDVVGKLAADNCRVIA